MTTRALSQTAAAIAAADIVFTLCVWAWIFSRPAGTFHDQGGLAITMIYFPATFCAWLVSTLASVVLSRRKSGDWAEADASRRLRQVRFGLVSLGLLLAIGTLFIA